MIHTKPDSFKIHYFQFYKIVQFHCKYFLKDFPLRTVTNTLLDGTYYKFFDKITNTREVSKP